MGFDLTQLPDEYLPAAEELPGDLRALAETVGVRATLAIVQRFRGSIIYVRNFDLIERRLRDQAIRRDYDQGAPVRQIARRHNLSTRWVREILGRPDEG